MDSNFAVDLCGFVWICVDLCRFVWICVDPRTKVFLTNWIPSGDSNVTLPNGDQYEGGWNTNGKISMQHGWGKLVKDDGCVYEGYWAHGQYHGLGKMTYIDNSCYDGEWKQGQYHGFGKLTYKNGDTYEGLMDRGKRHGRGKMVYIGATENTYNGEFKNGTIHGEGTMVYPSGDIYEGMWQNGKKHGKAYMKFACGFSFEGIWKEGIPYIETGEEAIIVGINGEMYTGTVRTVKISPDETVFEMLTTDGRFVEYGQYTDKCGLYSGKMYKRKLHGHGTLTNADGMKYVGNWANGKMHGHGTKTLPGGCKYVGNWANGKMHGHGTHTLPCGSEYVGGWANDKMNGHGTMTFDDGSKYVGNWANGNMHGHGAFTTTDGSNYVGEWADNKRHGHGTNTVANGSKYVGDWANGKMHGHGTVAFYDGSKYMGDFAKGKKHGQGTTILANGLMCDCEWVEGKISQKGKMRLTFDGERDNPVVATRVATRKYTDQWRIVDGSTVTVGVIECMVEISEQMSVGTILDCIGFGIREKAEEGPTYFQQVSPGNLRTVNYDTVTNAVVTIQSCGRTMLQRKQYKALLVDKKGYIDTDESMKLHMAELAKREERLGLTRGTKLKPSSPKVIAVRKSGSRKKKKRTKTQATVAEPVPEPESHVGGWALEVTGNTDTARKMRTGRHAKKVASAKSKAIQSAPSVSLHINLHGLSVDTAWSTLRAKIAATVLEQGDEWVFVNTGIGLHSDEGSVLKGKVKSQLDAWRAIYQTKWSDGAMDAHDGYYVKVTRKLVKRVKKTKASIEKPTRPQVILRQ